MLLQKILPRVTPDSLEITRSGRVRVAISDTKCGNQCGDFWAPEYKPELPVTSETSIEKVGKPLSNYPMLFVSVCWLYWTPRHTGRYPIPRYKKKSCTSNGKRFLLRLSALSDWIMTSVLTRQSTCVWRNIEACSHNHYCPRKAISITCSECVSLALVIQHAIRMRRIILSSVACLAVPCFSMLSHKRYDFRGEKKLLNTKGVFWFSPHLLSETFFSFYEEFSEILS